MSYAPDDELIRKAEPKTFWYGLGQWVKVTLYFMATITAMELLIKWTIFVWRHV